MDELADRSLADEPEEEYPEGGERPPGEESHDDQEEGEEPDFQAEVEEQPLDAAADLSR